MKKKILIVVIILMTTILSWSQGIVRGKVTDENGLPVLDVQIYPQNDKKTGALSDFDGNYNLNINTSNYLTLVVSYIGYDTIYEGVQLKNNEIVIKDFIISPIKTELEELKVVAKQIRSNDGYMERIKINSATTLDFISAETMKKTGDPTIASAVARVSGVSTNGGFITVRGIGDRYVKTTLNGSRIPTLDPLTNNIKLDIFPASLVDNIVITKTASPDLPGDWTGAYISVDTKDYPDKLQVNVESQFGYNNQSTFKDIVSSQRSSTDWLGFDNGLRNRKDSPINSPILNPSTYQEMVALGLGNYFNGMGINGWIDGTTEGNTYYKLGLVELGILPRALINDPTAVNNAINIYNSSYKNQAERLINPEGSDYNNGFAHNWNIVRRKAPLNNTQSFSIGDQVKLFGKPLGYIIGFRYASSIRYDPNGISQRVGAEQLNYPFDVRDSAKVSKEINTWSTLINLAYKLNDKNKVSFMFMPNYSGTNDVGNFATSIPSNAVGPQDGRTQNLFFYEQRKQKIYQFKTEHYIAKAKMKIDFHSSYTQGNSIAPDFKVIQYAYVIDNNIRSIFQFGPTVGDGVHRFYRYLSENIFDSRLSAEFPLINATEKLVRKVKFGGAYQRNDRKSDIEDFSIVEGNGAHPSPTNENIDEFLNANRFIMTNGKVDYYYDENNAAYNHSFGYSSIKAAFAMIDYELKSSIRFSGGLRVEQAKIFTDINDYYRLGYAKNDPRRGNGFGLQNSVNAANINEVNYLPSLNIIYKLKKIQIAKTNLRFNYSQTVARPSIRELNDAAVYDNEYRTLIHGNSDLKTVQIKNFDIRAESYFKNGDNVSVSLFYKDFKNHIEMGFESGAISWQNIDKSNVKGIEFEINKSISKQFEFRTNVTFVKSNSVFIRKDVKYVNGEKISTPIDTVNRSMLGQAPYIINALLMYKADSLGLTATISYNVQGPRLVITGIVKGRPDVYEMPRNTIDFKITKSLGKHFNTSITIRDILNAKVRRAYKLPNSWVDYDSFRYGTNFNLSISYKI